MVSQKQLVLQEVFEAVSLAMEDLIGHASDLESVGFNRDGEDLRQVAGQMENFLYRMNDRHK